MKEKLVLIFLALASLTACNKNVLVDSFHELPESGWSYNNIVQDSFEVKEPAFYHQMFANLRISGDYKYANIFLKLTIIAPDSSQKEEVVTLNLADKTGKWLGSGIGDKITFQLPVLDKQKLKEAGIYRVKIEQYMRLENLQNVVAAGIMVEQLEEI
jgi:gliding motility-associated lipoprotein GldH